MLPSRSKSNWFKWRPCTYRPIDQWTTANELNLRTSSPQILANPTISYCQVERCEVTSCHTQNLNKNICTTPKICNVLQLWPWKSWKQLAMWPCGIGERTERPNDFYKKNQVPSTEGCEDKRECKSSSPRMWHCLCTRVASGVSDLNLTPWHVWVSVLALHPVEL